MWIELKEFSFDVTYLVGFGVAVIPASHVSETAYTLSLWLNDVKDAITIIYDTVEERDAELDLVKSAVYKRS